VETVRDLRALSDEEKIKIYEELEKEHHGKIVMKAHRSGFPAVTVFVDDKPEFITDCLSVEIWWRKREGLTHFIIFPPEGTGYSVSTKTKEEAIQKAAEYFKVEPSAIDEAKGWKIENRGVNP